MGGTPPNAIMIDFGGGNYLIRFTATDRFVKSVSQQLPVFIEISGTGFIALVWIMCSLGVFAFLILPLIACKKSEGEIKGYLMAGEYAVAQEKAKKNFCHNFPKSCREDGIPYTWIKRIESERERAIGHLASGSSVMEITNRRNKAVEIEEELLFQWRYILQEKNLTGAPLEGNISHYVGLQTYAEFKNSDQSSLLFGGENSSLQESVGQNQTTTI